MKDSFNIPGATQSAFLDDVSLTDDQRTAARATLAAFGQDELADMLGIGDVA